MNTEEHDLALAIFQQNQQILQMLHESIRTNAVLASKLPGFGGPVSGAVAEEKETGGYISQYDNEENGVLEDGFIFAPSFEDLEKDLDVEPTASS